jgi:hypothetical protein
VDVWIHVFLISALVGGERSADELASRPGPCGENSWPYRNSKSDLWVVQPFASHYSDWAIPSPLWIELQQQIPTPAWIEFQLQKNAINCYQNGGDTAGLKMKLWVNYRCRKVVLLVISLLFFFFLLSKQVDRKIVVADKLLIKVSMRKRVTSTRVSVSCDLTFAYYLQPDTSHRHVLFRVCMELAHGPEITIHHLTQEADFRQRWLILF